MARVGGVAGDQLRSFVERAERLHEERSALAADLSELFSEAKGVGFNVKVIKKILAMRRRDQDDLDEEEALIDTYLRAIGDKPERGTKDATRARADTDA